MPWIYFNPIFSLARESHLEVWGVVSESGVLQLRSLTDCSALYKCPLRPSLLLYSTTPWTQTPHLLRATWSYCNSFSSSSPYPSMYSGRRNNVVYFTIINLTSAPRGWHRDYLQLRFTAYTPSLKRAKDIFPHVSIPQFSKNYTHCTQSTRTINQSTPHHNSHCTT